MKLLLALLGVLQNAGSVGMGFVVWVGCGLFSLIGAFCYAELGTTITKSGADYAYINYAFGPVMAFVRLWVECMVIRPCLIAIVALTCGNYLIYPFFAECVMPDASIRLIAAIGITILTVINCIEVKWATRVQDLFTFAKCLALVIIIVTGAVQLARGRTDSFKDPFAGTSSDPGSISLAIYQGLFAYNAWQYLNGITEEMKNPYVNLPRSLAGGLGIVTFLYVFSNVAYLTVLSPPELLASKAVAVTFADRMFGVMAWTMPIFVALSTFGGVNGMILTSSRLFFVGAREGHLPDILTYVQVNRLTPVPACIFTGFLSCLYLASSDIDALINYVSFSVWLFTGLSVFVIIWLRRREPDLPRPIKVPIVLPIIFCLCSIFLVIVPLIKEPTQTGIGLLIIFSGFPVYLIFIVWKDKPKMFQKKLDESYVWVQKLFLVVKAEDEDKVENKQKGPVEVQAS
jgi:L-type amino acid transporter 8